MPTLPETELSSKNMQKRACPIPSCLDQTSSESIEVVFSQQDNDILPTWVARVTVQDLGHLACSQSYM